MLRFVVVFIALMALSGCNSWHIDPTSGDTAKLIVKPVRVVEGEIYYPYAWVKVDARRVVELGEFPDPIFKSKTWKVKQPGRKALVATGLREVELDITATQSSGEYTYVKENTIKTEWLFEKNHTYEISLDVPTVVADPPDADSQALVVIVDRDSESEILRQQLVLEQKHRISPGGQSELATDIINTVIIPATIP